MIVVADHPHVSPVYLAVNRTYARPHYYWSTLVENAEVYPAGTIPLNKVRGQGLRAQVTNIRAVD